MYFFDLERRLLAFRDNAVDFKEAMRLRRLFGLGGQQSRENREEEEDKDVVCSCLRGRGRLHVGQTLERDEREDVDLTLRFFLVFLSGKGQSRINRLDESGHWWADNIFKLLSDFPDAALVHWPFADFR